MTIGGDLFRSTFHDSPIGMAVLDEAGTVIEVNPALAHGWRFGQGSLYGRPLPERELPFEGVNHERALAPPKGAG